MLTEIPEDPNAAKRVHQRKCSVLICEHTHTWRKDGHELDLDLDQSRRLSVTRKLFVVAAFALGLKGSILLEHELHGPPTKDSTRNEGGIVGLDDHQANLNGAGDDSRPSRFILLICSLGIVFVDIHGVVLVHVREYPFVAHHELDWLTSQKYGTEIASLSGDAFSLSGALPRIGQGCSNSSKVHTVLEYFEDIATGLIHIRE